MRFWCFAGDRLMSYETLIAVKYQMSGYDCLCQSRQQLNEITINLSLRNCVIMLGIIVVTITMSMTRWSQEITLISMDKLPQCPEMLLLWNTLNSNRKSDLEMGFGMWLGHPPQNMFDFIGTENHVFWCTTDAKQRSKKNFKNVKNI